MAVQDYAGFALGRYAGDSPLAPRAHTSWDEVYKNHQDADTSQPQSIQRGTTEGQREVASGDGPNPALSLSYPSLLLMAQTELDRFRLPFLEELRMMKTTNVEEPQGAQHVCIEWKVRAEELQKKNTKLVSQLFELPGAKVKMILSPSGSCDRRGGASFQSCKDLKLEVKCEEGQNALGCIELTFLIAVQGKVTQPDSCESQKRGPFEHDFNNSAVAGMPKDLRSFTNSAKGLGKGHQLVCRVDFLSLFLPQSMI